MKKIFCYILLAFASVSSTGYASKPVQTKCKNKYLKICSIYQPPPYLPKYNY